MDDPVWWVVEDAVWQGPFTLNRLIQKARDGGVTAGSLVWRPKLGDWTSLCEVPELAPVMQAMPAECQAVTKPPSRSFLRVLFLPAITPDQAPWPRFFARWIDLFLFGTPMLVLTFVLMSVAGFASIGTLLFLNILIVPLALVVEFVCLSLFGTTLGKALFGIRICNSQGGKPSWKQSAKRCFGVWFWGFCMNIPVLNIVSIVIAHDTVRQGKETRWDTGADLHLRQRNVKIPRYLFGVLIFLILILMSSTLFR